MLIKLIKYAESLGLDPDEMMEMTVLDFIIKIEDTKAMWKEVRNFGKTS